MNKKTGFTLIELLIVVAIIAILAAIAVPNFLEAQTRSKIARVRSDMRTVATALEAYRVDWNKLPPEQSAQPRSFPTTRFTGWNTTRDTAFEVLPNALTSPVSYISSMPVDTYKSSATMQLGPGVSSSSQNIGRSFQSPYPQDATFMYHNIALRNGLVSGYDQNDVNDYGSWRIFSMGPMRLWWSIGTGDPTMGWKYDPTNGTMSSGFLLRTEKDVTGENFSRS